MREERKKERMKKDMKDGYVISVIHFVAGQQ